MTVIQARPPATLTHPRSTAPAPTRPRRLGVTLVLVVADLAAALLVCFVGGRLSGVDTLALQAPVVALAWLGGLALVGEYRQFGSLGTRTRRLLVVALAMPTGLLLLAEVVGVKVAGVPVAVAALTCAAVGCTARGSLEVAVRRGARLRGLTHRVVLVGPAHVLPGVAERLAQHSHRFRVVASCPITVPSTPPTPTAGSSAAAVDTDPAGPPPAGDDGGEGEAGDPEIEACRRTVAGHDADTVVLVPDPVWDPLRMRRLRWALEDDVVRTFAWTGLWRAPAGRTHLDITEDLPMLHVSAPRRLGPTRAVKSLIDRAVAAAALLLTAPLLLTIVLAIRVNSRGPVIYRQQRVGRDGRTFAIWKFRTMYADADAHLGVLVTQNQGAGPLFKMRHDPRTTRVGRLLRRTSLDELPQLVNVLRGQMSLVGPRPALPAEVSRYHSDVRRRLTVPPGMTGLWQVSGRSDLTWAESVHLDLTYVDNWSLLLDLQIMARTFGAVVRGRGAY
ncbi:sugar transferase [Nocardioides sp. zg-536]|uniref:Sugar transferase n=1 Tax=Nocardioides faecalis TaxID=2803858 RepID=A0A938Y7D5_9ACTN|nr:sugar transferase [Nocardioides faecalis]MBM9458569.1 sugar transferase [Nocardioides faecalis]QVI58571.1 sugar transferase [Nocardioides faecalis]